MHAEPLVVGVAELRRRSGTRREFSLDTELPGLEISASRVPPGGAVHVGVTLESLPHSIVAAGTVTAPWVGECRRCLRAVTGTLESAVREVFEANPTEGETYPLADDHIDLEPMVRDAVILALPLAPLCDDACAGPAPAEFPVAPDAEPAGRDPRWAGLDQLRFD